MKHAENNHTAGKWRQVTAAITINLAAFTVGMAYGWTSAVIENFQDANSTTGMEPMTENDISWLSSSLALSLLLMIPFGSSLCERFGRQNIAVIEAVGLIATWLLRLFARNFYVLLAAQILTGICDGLSSLVILLYVTEISSDAIRGQLGSLYLFAITGGYLTAFVLAAVLPYTIMTACPLIVSIIHLLGVLLLPETPVYLIRKNRIDEAKRSLMWLRGNDKAAAESDQLKIEHYHQTIMSTKASVGIKDLFTDRTNLKSLMISVAMMIIQQMSGTIIMGMYIIRIINEVESPVDSYMASIMYGSAQLAGCWLSTLTVERCGRRPLLLLSSSTITICHCILGVFFILQTSGYPVAEYGWLPVAAVILFGFSFSSGVGPLAGVISNEVFNPELASICNSIFLVSYSVLAFALLKVFPLVTNVIGFHNCFFIFVLSSLIGFFIILFTIPETKGKSLESIREELQGVAKRKGNIV